MSRKRSLSSTSSSSSSSSSSSLLPLAKRRIPTNVPAETCTTRTSSYYYYVLCQVLPAETAVPCRPQTQIARCYTASEDAIAFVREMVQGWDDGVMSVWEHFDDGGKEGELLVRVTTNDVLEGEEITITVQRQKVPIYTTPQPPPPTVAAVYIIVQKDYWDNAMDIDGDDGGVATTTIHDAYADRKDANQAARRVLREVCGDLDSVGRIACRHEESMDENGLYSGCAYVKEERRCRVEVQVDRRDVR